MNKLGNFLGKLIVIVITVCIIIALLILGIALLQGLIHLLF